MTTKASIAAASYLDDIHAALPRVLALFDTNPASRTRGIGDRYRWAWKGLDFTNGTYQGAAHGLAALLAAGLLPDWLPRESVLARIDDIFAGTARLVKKDGSLDEILPNESSYCVTALVAFDLLRTLALLRDVVGEEKRKGYLDVVSPMVRHIAESRESHGIISNHLSVAAAALGRWQMETAQDVSAPLRALLSFILEHRSPEGWFKEYEGADPGYQSLTLDYLADLDRVMPELGLGPKLAATMEFLSWCCHPDGSYGGLYGSRNTRFLYPAGIEELAHEVPAAAAIAGFMRQSHSDRAVVGLAAMDDPNLIPMFNSFCRAAAAAAERPLPQAEPLPFEQDGSDLKRFDDAGLVFERSDGCYTVVNWRKGGVVQRYSGSSSQVDAGVCARDREGHWYTGQLAGEETKIEWPSRDTLCIEGPLTKYHVSLPSPLDFIVLRILCLTAMRFRWSRDAIKRILVHLLITRRRSAKAVFRRIIRFRPAFSIEDKWVVPAEGIERVESAKAIQAIHMASQGYWQRSDDRQ
ncbi:hypothetical protein [Pelagibius marinus]|uniref:hypothetical protein n=1 Tax=Pelagibius marinus TaxID=2762760 RepID=UPI001872EE06|nr:hypothetical protein [Pelagibius marinus]